MEMSEMEEDRNEWFRLDAKVLNAIRDLCNA